SDSIDAIRILNGARRLRISVSHCIELARPLEALGVKIYDLSRLLKHPELTEFEEHLLSERFDGRPPFVNTLDVHRVVSAIKTSKSSVDNLIDIIGRLCLEFSFSPIELAMAARLHDISLQDVLSLIAPVISVTSNAQDSLSQIEFSRGVQALLLRTHYEGFQ